MYKLCAYITIENTPGKVALDFIKVNSVEIKNSNGTLTDTCTIKLPRRISVLNGNINDVIKRGAKVTVKLGYDDRLETEFSGYIASVSADIPFTIECEDEMWQLKQQVFNKKFGRTTLKEIITYLYKGKIDVDPADMIIPGLIIPQINGAKALELLKKYGISAYFRNDVLTVRFAGAKESLKPVRYDFKRNIIDNQLKYARQDDLKISVKAISKFKDGKIISVIVGDQGGDMRTLNYVNLDRAELERQARNMLERMKYDGYKGSFKTFGIPFVRPGYTAVMNDPDWPERKGSYTVNEVHTTYDMNGFRREVSPLYKIS